MQIYNKQGIYKATDKYVSITKQTYKDIWNLRKIIKLKAKLVNNIGVQTWKIKPYSGKKDDSDIPLIIDELNEEQKNRNTWELILIKILMKQLKNLKVTVH